MKNVEREYRYKAAMAELEEFCKIFGMSLHWNRYADGLMLIRDNYTVMADQSLYTRRSKTVIAESLLKRLKHGRKLVWVSTQIKQAEGGTIETRIKRTYKIPPFESVSQLKLILTAQGSEFA